MNEVIRQLAARKSVRAFEDRDIPGEVRAAILEAAAQAPTAGNQQLYTILNVTDPQLKALAKLVLPTNEEDGVAWALDRLTAGTLPQG